MNKILTNKLSEKAIAWIIITIFLISLIPLFYIAPYCHPTTDDYVYGAEAYHTWNETHSLPQTVRTAFDVTADTFTNWQGTYSACFLMSLQPDVFGIYWITPFILILSFISANYWLYYIVMRKYLKATQWQYLIVSTTIILMSMQCIPSPFDAFYWYNGGMYYTLYYAACLFLACFIILCSTLQNKIKKTVYGSLAMLVCIFIAGGNYVTGLIVPVILTFSIFVLHADKRKIPTILYIALATFMIGFLFSITAPGNSIRATHEESTPALYAIWLSFTNGCYYITKFTSPTICALFLVLLPIIFRLARQMKFGFPYPWLFTLSTYAIYCALFTPTCYALGHPGFERNFNLYLYCYVWLIMVNLFYISGAIWQQSLKGNVICKDLTSLANHIKIAITPYNKYLYIVITFVFVVTILQTSASSKRVLRDITSGRASKFDEAMKDRMAKYKSGEQDIIFPTLSVQPESLITFDITFDKGHWINQGVCMYYKKHSVMIDTLLTEWEKEEQRIIYRKEVGPGNLVYKNN